MLISIFINMFKNLENPPPFLPSEAFEGMELEDYKLSLLPSFPAAWNAVMLISPSL